MLEKIIDTPFGDLCVMVAANTLVYCNWSTPDCSKKYEKVSARFRHIHSEDESRLLEETRRQLEEYFAGERKKFSVSPLYTGTPFQISAWREIDKIVYGETLEYGVLARRLGISGGARAVARACGANPIAVITPCHRVISKNGKIGGYTGGVEKKIGLLELEQRKK